MEANLLNLHFEVGLPSIILLLAYLLGSIPFGLLVARIFKVKDVTQKGSGNIGATNISRVIGFWPAGFVTFVLDVGKGVLAVFLATPLGLEMISNLFGSRGKAFDSSTVFVWSAGFLVVLGHCFSPWIHFKGGKGVATGLGVITMFSPISALLGLVGFGVTFFHTRIASLASITGLSAAAITYLVLNPMGAHLWIGAALLFLVLMRHETNIDALLENREKRFR